MEIIGLKPIENTTKKSGVSGDNWHMTWANDNKQYVALCDGVGWKEIKGFTGQPYNTRVYGISGEATNHKYEHLFGFPDLFSEKGWNVNRYYGFGILALNGFIYHFLSTPNHPFHQSDPRFIGVKLIYSPDNGITWKNQDGEDVIWEIWDKRNKNNMLFFYEPDEAFSLLTILQMGKNYEWNTDGYIYIYSTNGNIEGKMNQLVMARVLKEQILNKNAYEYFVSRNKNNESNWTTDIKKRGIVHSFPYGWVNKTVHPYSWYPSVIYNKALDSYIMVNWGMGCASDGLWFGKPSYLGFWKSKHPWGPWTQIYENTAWMPDENPQERAYQPQISPKWISEDGKMIWLVFTDYQGVIGNRPGYRFKYQQWEILTK